mmetsp:Transcript_3859/g.9385  ORF Transcript_3859/g.9385 Transcript_3859/m.9385 type:complete len:238 (-) Transcript_3859:10-723(-)
MLWGLLAVRWGSCRWFCMYYLTSKVVVQESGCDRLLFGGCLLLHRQSQRFVAAVLIGRVSYYLSQVHQLCRRNLSSVRHAVLVRDLPPAHAVSGPLAARPGRRWRVVAHVQNAHHLHRERAGREALSVCLPDVPHALQRCVVLLVPDQRGLQCARMVVERRGRAPLAGGGPSGNGARHSPLARGGVVPEQSQRAVRVPGDKVHGVPVRVLRSGLLGVPVRRSGGLLPGEYYTIGWEQ